MHIASEAIVIQCGPSRRPHLPEALSAVGWSVRGCNAIAQLGALADQRAPQLLVLETPTESLCTLAGMARFTVPGAVLIAMADAEAVGPRVLALDAGADACCTVQVDIRELSALGRALCRRREARPARPAGPAPAWQLTSGGRVLAGPAGQRLPLTLTESVFLLRLLSTPGHRLPRERLVTASGEAHAEQSPRSVDVMVSRLRAKAQRLGVELPLLAVRQWGYMFLADETCLGGGAADRPCGAPGERG
ncbi:winged helix-turn-helix domain-containing protein [Bordetella petrii]|uniref:Winged helix-turn-helix domain-containing protein n=1 Tax=Bordetella petrii TaxID=94624 RepID=A0ABT7W6R8_9BORD|nr:winged helix-turn-helix domain-containing protein [Bordetella petrii]MDM9560896.1 winged helix-turn-helix domain-containing protein [Bordetella petrii]